MSWRTLSEFPIWGTNVPVEWLKPLKFSESFRRIEEVLAEEEELATVSERLRTSLAEAVVGDEPRKARNKLLVTLRDSGDPSAPLQSLRDMAAVGESLATEIRTWHECVRRNTERLDSARQAFLTELAAKREILWRTTGLPEFERALMQLNPDFLHQIQNTREHASSRKRDSQMRRKENTIASYIARLCTKSSIAGRIGPTCSGKFTPAKGPNVSFQWLEPSEDVGGIAATKAFFAHWGARDLAERLSETPDLRLRLPLRLHPCVVQEDNHLVNRATGSGGVFLPTEETAELSPELGPLLSRLDGHISALDLVRRDSSGLAEISELLKRRFLLAGLDIPAGHFEPLTYLLELLDRASPRDAVVEEWRTRLARFEVLRKEYEASPPETRIDVLQSVETLFQECTGKEPRRGAGEYYADRFLLFEECTRACTPLEFGPEVLRELTAHLSLGFEFLAPYWFFEALHPAFITHTAPSAVTGRPDFTALGLTVLRALQTRPPPEILADSRVVYWIKGIKELLAMLSEILEPQNEDAEELVFSDDDPKIRQYRARLSDLIKKAPFPIPLFTSSAFFEIGARDLESLNRGDFTIIFDSVVIGGGMNLSISSCFSPGRSAQMAETESALAKLYGSPGRRLAGFVFVPQQPAKFSSFIHPGIDIELLGASFKSEDSRATPREMAPSPGEPTSFELRTAAGTVPVKLIMPHTLRVDRKLLAEEFEGHFPRIRIGRTILQRANWRLAGTAFKKATATTGDPFQTYLNVLRTRRSEGLPTSVFAEPSGPGKNIFIDFENFFLVEVLVGLARESELLRFSEFSPSEGEFWFGNRKGDGHMTLAPLPFFYYSTE